MACILELRATYLQVHKATLLDGRPVAIKVQYPGVADSIVSDLWSMRQLITYTGVVPPGLYLDRVLEVAREELLEECDYEREASRSSPTLLTACHMPCERIWEDMPMGGRAAHYLYRPP